MHCQLHHRRSPTDGCKWIWIFFWLHVWLNHQFQFKLRHCMLNAPPPSLSTEHSPHTHWIRNGARTFPKTNWNMLEYGISDGVRCLNLEILLVTLRTSLTFELKTYRPISYRRVLWALFTASCSPQTREEEKKWISEPKLNGIVKLL